jgi:hypothetical protein
MPSALWPGRGKRCANASPCGARSVNSLCHRETDESLCLQTSLPPEAYGADGKLVCQWSPASNSIKLRAPPVSIGFRSAHRSRSFVANSGCHRASFTEIPTATADAQPLGQGDVLRIRVSRPLPRTLSAAIPARGRMSTFSLVPPSAHQSQFGWSAVPNKCYLASGCWCAPACSLWPPTGKSKIPQALSKRLLLGKLSGRHITLSSSIIRCFHVALAAVVSRCRQVESMQLCASSKAAPNRSVKGTSRWRAAPYVER